MSSWPATSNFPTEPVSTHRCPSDRSSEPSVAEALRPSTPNNRDPGHVKPLQARVQPAKPQQSSRAACARSGPSSENGRSC